MTSQIVVMNQGGISIASDTLTSNSEPHGEIKTIPSNSKIHQLESAHLVAVLHCGSVFLGGVQWETLVREWSLSLEKRLPHLIDYVKNFEDWISKNHKLFCFNENALIGQTICREFMDIFRFTDGPLITALVAKTTDPNSISDNDFNDQICNAIEEWMGNNFKGDPYGDIELEEANKLVSSDEVDVYKDFLEHTKEYGEFEFSKKVQTLLNKFAAELIIRFVPTRDCVILNFVGYGSNDIMGQRAEATIRSFYAGALRLNVETYGSNDPADYPMCSPIAQQDAIGSFMWGVDNESRWTLRSVALDVFDEIVKLTDEQKQEFSNKFGEKSAELLRNEFAQPLLNTISTLGLTGMTRFAEMMIRFQCLRSASIAGEATVGGFIESLSISRDMGVDWHQRMSLESHPLEHSSHVFA